MGHSLIPFLNQSSKGSIKPYTFSKSEYLKCIMISSDLLHFLSWCMACNNHKSTIIVNSLKACSKEEQKTNVTSLPEVLRKH